jgi:hypothetical protein
MAFRRRGRWLSGDVLDDIARRVPEKDGVCVPVAEEDHI